MPKKNRAADKEPKISYYEASLNYKLTLKEAELEEINKELKEHEGKLSNLHQRNARLKETREVTLQKTLKEYKDYLHKNDSQEKCDKEDVIAEWNSLWTFQKKQDDEINTLKSQIKQIESEVSRTKKEIRSFSEYKSRGKDEFETQINTLKTQIDAMHSNFEVMKSHLVQDLEATRDQINQNTELSLAKQHKTTAEKVFKEMDKHTIQMMHDNKWMEEKINIYVDESKVLEEETANLEKQNLELMNRLFEYNSADFKFSKIAFQTQFLDNDNLQTHTILDIDLDKFETIRSVSPVVREMPHEAKIEEEYQEEEQDAENDVTITQQQQQPPLLSFTSLSLMTREPTTLKDKYEFKTPMYTDRGSYEIKALGLQGKKKPIYIPKSNKEIMDNDNRNDEWPITQDMLQSNL